VLARNILPESDCAFRGPYMRAHRYLKHSLRARTSTSIASCPRRYDDRLAQQQHDAGGGPCQQQAPRLAQEPPLQPHRDEQACVREQAQLMHERPQVRVGERRAGTGRRRSVRAARIRASDASGSGAPTGCTRSRPRCGSAGHRRPGVASLCQTPCREQVQYRKHEQLVPIRPPAFNSRRNSAGEGIRRALPDPGDGWICA